MSIIEQYTGKSLDTLADSLGLNNILLRYQGTQITPTPMVTFSPVTSNPEGQFGQLGEPEQLQTYIATVPATSLTDSLGANYKDALQPYQVWEVSSDVSSDSWIKVRTAGDPQWNPIGLRWEITLIVEGIDEDFSTI